ncbi:MAG: tetratricopeptide repeat protein [Candidatus Gorgyraea atricola]|nr:tetratricopeptide repeat protein [Candidatus Gorgyraea atricola]
MEIRHRLINIFIIFAMLLWSVPGYAQEQYIAESFGLYSRGIDYYHAGKLHEAKDILERAVSLDPRNNEAQGYLDLVNAELKMRARGQLDVYQSQSELKRESDLEEPDEYYYYEIEDADIEDEYEYEYEYEYYEDEPDKPRHPEDKIKAISDALNESIAPSQIIGEYKMSLGATNEDVIWKDANGDYNERNFRMINNDFPKTNTFDTRVYDSFKLAFDTNENEEGLNFHSDITVDPWSFVGKTDKFTVADNSATDRVELELKYWSGTRSTINETFYTSDYNRNFSTLEYKVTDGKIPAFIATSKDQDGNAFDTYSIPEQEVDFTFQPLRELWVDYNTDDYKFRVFPFGLENQALSSDDPLGLSNHHIYWEPSPWLDEWIPGHVNSEWNPDDFWRGQWSDDLPFFTRDSELKRLTALRGVSFEGLGLFGNTDLSATVATPKGLWQDYESVNAIPGALRTKTQLTDELMIGLTGTFRVGYDDSSKDSYNHVSAVDASYDLNPTTNIAIELAMSDSEYDRSSSYKTEKNGSAAKLAVKKDMDLGNAKLSFTHMDSSFDPGLANYTETRRDQFWGRHIHFEEPLQWSIWGSDPLTYDDIEPFRIGDGIDTGRDVVNFRLDTEDVFGERMDNLIDYRYVKDSDHKYVEGVFREENTLRINPEWTSKLLFLYHDLPKTKGGIDPVKYDSDTGEFYLNSAIQDGQDATMSTYSLGLEYEPEGWISIFGIYENTNDSTFATDNHPRDLLENFSFSTDNIEGNTYRDKLPFLYSQGYFDLPPYDRFNIYRAGISLKPSENLGVDFDYTRNDFKFAQSIDNNMNHFGTTLKYKFNNKLTGFLKYTYSKAYDLYKLSTSGDLKYEDHHNIFMELNYNVTEYGLLTIQFGEGSVLSPVYGATTTPFGDSYLTLDTQHIVRIYYNGRF